MLEGGSLLSWNFNVFMHATKRMLTEQQAVLSILDDKERVALSDTFHVMQQSAIIFKHMAALLKHSNESQLISFLRKLKKLLNAVELGESLMLPLLIEYEEKMLIFERTAAQQYTFVIVETDAENCMYHAVSAAGKAPFQLVNLIEN